MLPIRLCTLRACVASFVARVSLRRPIVVVTGRNCRRDIGPNNRAMDVLRGAETDTRTETEALQLFQWPILKFYH